MIKIAPSILSADFVNLARDIHACQGADYIHLDVMDGHFVPNLTIGIPVVRAIHGCTDLPLDVHLMIREPERYVEDFAAAGAAVISVHLEADFPSRIGPTLARIRACGVKAALALRPITAPEAVIPYIEQLDMVLVMTVEPGFGGQAFMEFQLETVRRVREIIDARNPACELEVDGGVHSGTAPRVVEAGANVLVAGSAVFRGADPAGEIARLRRAARGE